MARDTRSIDDETDSRGRVPSGLLERTLGILELLAANARGLQIYEIAEFLQIPRSATHRVLTSLVEHGYVRQEREHGAYQLTVKIASLGFSYLSGSGITDLAQPIIDRLANSAGELVRLAMIDGKDLIWVAKAQGSPYGLRYDPDMGQIGRLSCSASGIAWLACLSDNEAFELVERQGFGRRDQYGPRAPESRRALLKYLQQTRKSGISVTIQTYTSWMNATAVAIKNRHTGEVVGTVVIAGPHIRLTEGKMLGLSPCLLQAADELSLAMVASPGLVPSPGRRPSFFQSATGPKSESA